MTERERLLRAIRGIDTDRVPVAPFIFNNFISEQYGSDKLDFVEKGIEIYKRFNFDIILRTCNVGGYLDERLCDSVNWRVSEECVNESDSSWNVITTIRTPEREMRKVESFCRITPFEVVQATTECYIKSEDDFKQFVKFQPPVPTYDCSVIKQARELLGDDGIAAPWAQGAFNMMSFYRKIDDLLTDPFYNPELFGEMSVYFPARLRQCIAQMVKAGADLICCGGNVATATMVGPSFFEEFIQPLEILHTKEIKNMGVSYLYHNCGDAAALLPLYSKIGMDVYESLTPPPYGDTDFDTALEVIDRNITLCGNIDQVTFLKEATPLQIREKVQKVLKKVKRRGNFILGTTDYFGEGTPLENIMAFSEAGFEYGKY